MSVLMKLERVGEVAEASLIVTGKDQRDLARIVEAVLAAAGVKLASVSTPEPR